MSYTIVYDRQFLKVQIGLEESFIPLFLAGSNNSSTFNCFTRRYKRSRDWSCFKVSNAEFKLRFGMPVVLMNESHEVLNELCPEDSEKIYFKKDNKWVGADGFRRFWNNGVKNALTIEEINEQRLYSVSLSVIAFEVEPLKKISEYTTLECTTSEEIEEALNLFSEGWAKYKDEGRELLIDISFSNEELLTSRVKKLEYRKNNVKDSRSILDKEGKAFVIKSHDMGYIDKLTARNLFHTPFTSQAKQFKTEKEAQRWIDKKLKPKFLEDYVNKLKIMEIEA